MSSGGEPGLSTRPSTTASISCRVAADQHRGWGCFGTSVVGRTDRGPKPMGPGSCIVRNRGEIRMVTHCEGGQPMAQLAQS